MSVVVLHTPATTEQLEEMLQDWGALIKLVVDIERQALAGGGEMHADGESALIDDGSRQEDLWGANWYPDTKEVRFEALINIRPRHGNVNLEVHSASTRSQMESIIRRLLEVK